MSRPRRGGWDREHFTYDAELDRYVCPQGRTLRRIHDNVASRQQVYRAPFGVCPSCPVRQECGPGLRARTVTRSFDHQLLEAARVHVQTGAGRAALRKRKQFIELVFADAKVRHCLARAQRRGRDNMLIQALLTAATMNLRKLVQFQPPGWVRGPRLWRALDPFRPPCRPSDASPTGPPVPERRSLHSPAICSCFASEATSYRPSATASTMGLD